jgi:hypothetical protein
LDEDYYSQLTRFKEGIFRLKEFIIFFLSWLSWNLGQVHIFLRGYTLILKLLPKISIQAHVA